MQFLSSFGVLAGLSDVLGVFWFVFLLVFGGVLFVLGLLMPYFVWRICRSMDSVAETNVMLVNTLRNMEKHSASVESHIRADFVNRYGQG